MVIEIRGGSYLVNKSIDQQSFVFVAASDDAENRATHNVYVYVLLDCTQEDGLYDACIVNTGVNP